MILDVKNIVFKPFSLGRPREPKVYILLNVDTIDSLALLHLFISLEMFITIAENINLYAITSNALTALISTNKRY